MQSPGCAKFGCPLLVSHVYGNLFSSSPNGSYFMGFQNNQVDRIKKGLFILAFTSCFMIGLYISQICYWRRSQFPSKLHHWHETQFLCISKPLSRYWYHKGQTLRNCPWQCLLRVGAHHITNLTYITDPCFPVHASVPWLSKCRQLEQAYTAGRERLPHFFFSLFSSQLGLFQNSSLSNEDTVKDHLSAGNLPVSFPQFPLKDKPAVVGKSPKHLGTRCYGTRHGGTEASAEPARRLLHGSCCGHAETGLAQVFQPRDSSSWFNRMVKRFCVRFLMQKGSKDNASSRNLLAPLESYIVITVGACRGQTVSDLQLN